MDLTELSIKRPTLIMVIFIVLSFLGVSSYLALSYELVPKFSPPNLFISTIYPGASPSEVEKTVTKKIEDAISVVENIDKIRSASQESFSLVRIEMKPGTDVDKSVQDMQRQVNAIVRTLPPGTEAPVINRFDFADLPIIRLGIFSKLSDTEIFDLVKSRIQPSLAQIEGVAQVRILGGSEREIRVNIDKRQLEANGLSIMQVTQLIKASNLDFPTGKIQDEEGQVMLRLAGKYESLAELENLVVGRSRFGSSILLKDLAEIKDTKREVEIISRVNSKGGIALSIQKQSDANAVTVSERVKEIIAELEERYEAEGVTFEIGQDSSEFTLQAAEQVMEDLLYAIILVSLVMLLFLHSIRNSLIVLISIPTSIVSTFIVMFLLGYSLNLMTLLGLSLAIGILVDDAIVVIENIYRHLEMGKDRVLASYEGRMEIGFTALSITLVDVVVFTPIIFSEGLVADLLRQFAVVVVASTMMSLFVSFTLVPFLTSRFAKLEHLNPNSIIGKMIGAFEGFIDAMADEVAALLQWSFRNKTITLLLALGMMGGAIALIPYGYLGLEFLDAGDRGEFLVELELPKDASLSQSNFITQQAEAYIDSYQEVTSVFTTIGATRRSQAGQSTPYLAELNIQLVPKQERNISTELLARKIKLGLESQLVGIQVKPVSINILGMAEDAPIQIDLTGPSLDSLKVFASKIEAEVAKVPGTVEIMQTAGEGNPEVKVEIDRDRLAEFGLNMGGVGQAMRTAFNGNRDTKYRDGDNEYDIFVRLDDFDRKQVDDVQDLTFVNPMGQLVKLKQFAGVNETLGPARLERKNRIAAVTINTQVIGRPTGTVASEIDARIQELRRPEGVTIEYGGDVERQSKGFGSLGFALLVSIVLVYLVMVALYDSYVYPFVVLFSIPLAVIGALLALALVKQSLNIFSILGMLMLVGLVAKNAILVVDFTNQLKDEGKDFKEALTIATKLRFRPILMTNLSMVIGLLPIALAVGAGAEWKNGLAWALIGGLSSSMILSLIIVPVIYYIMDSILMRLGWDKKKVIEIYPQDLPSS